MWGTLSVTVSFAVFTLVYLRIIQFSVVLLYISVIVGAMSLAGSVPLFFELTCESTYPVAEGITNGFLTWLNNIPSLIFLLIMMDSSIGECRRASPGEVLPIPGISRVCHQRGGVWENFALQKGPLALNCTESYVLRHFLVSFFQICLTKGSHFLALKRLT